MEDSAVSSSPSSILNPLSSSSARPLWPAYACESLASVGTSLLQGGIFFYTQHYFGWGMKQNFRLAAAQGAVYVIGSLASAGMASRFGRRRALVAIYLGMMLLAICALAAGSSPGLLIVALLGHTFTASLNWPAVESLVTAGADAHAMSRRVGMYNLVWSATNSLTFAASGTIIQHWRAGLFLVPAVAHASGAILMLVSRNIEPAEQSTDHAHVQPEPQLLARRTLALWLARISLPATYIVIFSMMAMMPSLPVMRALSPAIATLVGSAWMAARFVMFYVLGATVWWHTRPGLLLASAALMLIAFIGVTIRPSDFAGGTMPYTIDLCAMLAWQVLLGAAMGVIYAGSLYFGMVLSQGSTEHGGYHEALIGLGSIAGPGAAAIVQQHWPGSVPAGVIAVASLLTLTLTAAAIAAFRATRRQ